MTEEERERERLRYIEESITLVEQYTQGSEQAFFREPIIQDAVLRRLETMADATNKLSDALKDRHPEIPWRRIYGFRHIAAHAYEDLDLSRVWEIVENYLPSLRIVVDEELPAGAETDLS
ncbi:MAG: DUF86 domain-containing protein [Chloroflexota bacterium]|nr:DUF86 domain-containing protein [Chloroflexota bacterium]